MDSCSLATQHVVEMIAPQSSTTVQDSFKVFNYTMASEGAWSCFVLLCFRWEDGAGSAQRIRGRW